MSFNQSPGVTKSLMDLLARLEEKHMSNFERFKEGGKILDRSSAHGFPEAEALGLISFPKGSNPVGRPSKQQQDKDRVNTSIKCETIREMIELINNDDRTIEYAARKVGIDPEEAKEKLKESYHVYDERTESVCKQHKDRMLYSEKFKRRMAKIINKLVMKNVSNVQTEAEKLGFNYGSAKAWVTKYSPIKDFKAERKLALIMKMINEEGKSTAEAAAAVNNTRDAMFNFLRRYGYTYQQKKLVKKETIA